MRTFIAVDVSDENAVREITRLQKEILETGADVKLVERDNLHFTIKFLGEISEQPQRRVCEEISTLSFPPLKVTYEGMGAFPSISHISVVWIGLDKEGGEKLTQIASKVEERIGGLRLGDSKPFTPHLTVARVRTGRNRERLIRLISDSRDRRFGEDTLTALKVKKSDLTPRGPIYTDLYTLIFREGA